MNRREKIIVIVMAASVVLGGYLYYNPGPTVSRQRVEPPSEGPALDFAQKVIQKLKEDTTLTRDLYTIRSAERKWEKDPFLTTDTLLSDAPPQKVADTEAATASPN